jgi:hypothetical protein
VQFAPPNRKQKIKNNRKQNNGDSVLPSEVCNAEELELTQAAFDDLSANGIDRRLLCDAIAAEGTKFISDIWKFFDDAEWDESVRDRVALTAHYLRHPDKFREFQKTGKAAHKKKSISAADDVEPEGLDDCDSQTRAQRSGWRTSPATINGYGNGKISTRH